jgi:hypothetical protein
VVHTGEIFAKGLQELPMNCSGKLEGYPKKPSKIPKELVFEVEKPPE